MRDDELSMSWGWSRLWTRPPYVLSAAATAALVRKMQYLGRRTKWVPLTRTRRYRSPTTNVHLSACSCTHARTVWAERCTLAKSNQINATLWRGWFVIIALLQSPVLTDTISRFAEWVDGTNNNRKEGPGGVRAWLCIIIIIITGGEERRGARDEATRAPRVQIALNNAENKTKEGEIHFQKNRVNRIERHGTRRQRMLVIKNWW